VQYSRLVINCQRERERERGRDSLSAERMTTDVEGRRGEGRHRVHEIGNPRGGSTCVLLSGEDPASPSWSHFMAVNKSPFLAFPFPFLPLVSSYALRYARANKPRRRSLSLSLSLSLPFRGIERGTARYISAEPICSESETRAIDHPPLLAPRARFRALSSGYVII